MRLYILTFYLILTSALSFSKDAQNITPNKIIIKAFQQQNLHNLKPISNNKNYSAFNQALYFFLNGKLIKSYNLFNKALFYKNNFEPKALFFMAKILILQKKFSQARNLISAHIKKLKRHPYFLKLIFLIAKTRFYQKDYKKTISILKHIEKKQLPQNVQILNIMPPIYLLLGQSYFYLKEFDMAKFYFNLIISKFPNLVETLFAKLWIKDLKYRKNLATKEVFFASFLIQAGLFKNLDYATTRKNFIQNLNFTPRIISQFEKDVKVYKVVIPVASKERANLIINSLKLNNISSFLISNF